MSALALLKKMHLKKIRNTNLFKMWGSELERKCNFGSCKRTLILYKLAYQYKKHDLAASCLSYIQDILDTNNLPNFLQEAEEHKLLDLKKMCLTFIFQKNLAQSK